MTPTARSLKYLRDLGMEAAIVERWNSHARIRQDLFGFADVLSASDSGGIIAVQATSSTNVAARLRKVRDEPLAWAWLRAGGRIWVIGWGKRGARGKRKVWNPRVVEITQNGEIELEDPSSIQAGSLVTVKEHEDG